MINALKAYKPLLKQKILSFIDYKRITKATFYQETDITRGILDQNNGLSEENLLKFLAKYKEISLDWLLLGEGQMIRTNKENSSITNVANIQGNNNNNIQNTDNMLIESLRKAIEAQEETIKVQRDLITSLQDEMFRLNRDKEK